MWCRAEPVIDGVGNGFISWTNSTTQGVYTVEWSASVATELWAGTWGSLNHQPMTGLSMTVSVPMFFRVRVDPVRMDMVVVSNAHNAADSTGYGSVHYAFRIGQCEVNNSQYAQFLNVVDPGGSNNLQLYSAQMAVSARGGITNTAAATTGAHYSVRSNMGDKPVNFVSYWDAARFVNWLHNGQGPGGTESGAYDLPSLYPTNATVARQPGARYFLPSEDEWYKAAYFDGGLKQYWLYPLRTNAAPRVALCDSAGAISNGANAVVNYALGAAWNGVTGTVTTVGSAGAGSATFYGALDMAGNVYEWNEGVPSSEQRGIRGGAWYSSEVFLRSTARNGFAPTYELDDVGFRVAGAP